MITMSDELRFDDIRRSTPEQEAEHKRWAKLVLHGASLRELRELKGRTQAQIGEALGVTQVQAGRKTCFVRDESVKLRIITEEVAQEPYRIFPKLPNLLSNASQPTSQG